VVPEEGLKLGAKDDKKWELAINEKGEGPSLRMEPWQKTGRFEQGVSHLGLGDGCKSLGKVTTV